MRLPSNRDTRGNMKTNTLLMAILVIVLVSCAPAPLPIATVLPTSTAAPTASPLPSATPRPSAILTMAADLYSGPGNVGFEPLAQLPIGSQVVPTGTYVDFVKVDEFINGVKQEGYLPERFFRKLARRFTRVVVPTSALATG